MSEQPIIQVWMGIGGTTGECGCGWRSMTPAGVLPGAVMAQAESHEAATGHHWPTEAETLSPAPTDGCKDSNDA